MLTAGLSLAFPIQSIACSFFPTLQFQIETQDNSPCRLGSASDDFAPELGLSKMMKDAHDPPHSDCNSIVLSEEEQNFFAGIVYKHRNKNLGLATGIFEKQSAREFEKFLENNKDSQNDKCSCRIGIDIERNGDWTFYIDTRKSTCGVRTDCSLSPPEGCGDTPVDYFNGQTRPWSNFEKIAVSMGVSLLVLLLLIFFSRLRS